MGLVELRREQGAFKGTGSWKTIERAHARERSAPAMKQYEQNGPARTTRHARLLANSITFFVLVFGPRSLGAENNILELGLCAYWLICTTFN